LLKQYNQRHPKQQTKIQPSNSNAVCNNVIWWNTNEFPELMELLFLWNILAHPPAYKSMRRHIFIWWAWGQFL